MNMNTNKIKKASIFFLVNLLFYFILSLLITSILQSNAPKGSEIDYFAKKSWYPIVSYGVFPLSFLITFIVFNFGFKEKQLFAPDPKLEIKYLPYILISTFGLLFGLSQLNELFIKFLQKTINYKAETMVLPDFSIQNFIICFVFICVLPVFCEDLLFRKIFEDASEEQNEFVIAFILGGLFAVFHMNPAQTIYQFIFGTFMIFVVKITKNFLSTVIMHFLNNTLILIFYYSGVNSFPIYLFWIGLACFVGCLVYSIIVMAKRKQKKCNRELLSFIPPYAVLLFIWVLQLL